MGVLPVWVPSVGGYGGFTSCPVSLSAFSTCLSPSVFLYISSCWSGRQSGEQHHDRRWRYTAPHGWEWWRPLARPCIYPTPCSTQSLPWLVTAVLLQDNIMVSSPSVTLSPGSPPCLLIGWYRLLKLRPPHTSSCSLWHHSCFLCSFYHRYGNKTIKTCKPCPCCRLVALLPTANHSSLHKFG